jgi:hypothetical protein
MAFKINKVAAVALESPEALFRDIKTKKVHGPLGRPIRDVKDRAPNMPDQIS